MLEEAAAKAASSAPQQKGNKGRRKIKAAAKGSPSSITSPHGTGKRASVALAPLPEATPESLVSLGATDHLNLPSPELRSPGGNRVSLPKIPSMSPDSQRRSTRKSSRVHQSPTTRATLAVLSSLGETPTKTLPGIAATPEATASPTRVESEATTHAGGGSHGSVAGTGLRAVRQRQQGGGSSTNSLRGLKMQRRSPRSGACRVPRISSDPMDRDNNAPSCGRAAPRTPPAVRPCWSQRRRCGERTKEMRGGVVKAKWARQYVYRPVPLCTTMATHRRQNS